MRRPLALALTTLTLAALAGTATSATAAEQSKPIDSKITLTITADPVLVVGCVVNSATSPTALIECLSR